MHIMLLRHLWTHYRLTSLLSIGILIGVALSTLLFPFLLHRLLDQGLVTSNQSALGFYVLCLIGAGFLLGSMSAARVLSMHWLTGRLVTDLEEMLYARLLQQGPRFFREKPLSEIFPIFFQDMTKLRTLFTTSVSLCLRNGFLFIGAIGLMVYASATFTAIILGLIILIVVPIIALLRFMKRFAKQAQQADVRLATQIRESLEMVDTVRAFRAYQIELARFSHFTQAAFARARVYMLVRALTTAFAFFVGISGIVCVIWLGSLSIIHAQLSPGSLIQFFIAAFIAATSLAALSETAVDLHTLSQISQRIDAILHTPADLLVQLSQSDGVTFEHVNFSYPHGPQVLYDVTFHVPQGHILGIVGPSGSGKSTLFNLILGFYTPATGSIGRIGPCAYVPQDAMLFNRSIIDNIRYGKPDASLDDVRRVAQLAVIDTFIMELPEQYATHCGERAALFSPGQRQRIAIARALLTDAPILLLDEISSNLDAESEEAIMHTLVNIRAHYTILMISHRLNTMRITDEIIFLDGGRITLRGTHHELAKNANAYRAFLELQKY